MSLNDLVASPPEPEVSTPPEPDNGIVDDADKASVTAVNTGSNDDVIEDVNAVDDEKSRVPW